MLRKAQTYYFNYKWLQTFTISSHDYVLVKYHHCSTELNKKQTKKTRNIDLTKANKAIRSIILIGFYGFYEKINRKTLTDIFLPLSPP